MHDGNPHGERVRCLACGLTYDTELCPQRYLAPHSEEFMTLVAKELGSGEQSRERHEAAIEAAKEKWKVTCGISLS